jgi:hypothetical protein
MGVSWASFVHGFIGELVVGETALLVVFGLFRYSDADAGEEYSAGSGTQFAARAHSRHVHHLVDS